MPSGACECRFRNAIFGPGEPVRSRFAGGVDRMRFRAFLDGYWPHLLTAILFVLIAITLFGIAMSRGLHRDENQFIAAGALFVRQGLLK
jgi:hypothetical protein